MRFDRQAPQYDLHASIQREVADWCATWLETEAHGLSALELGAGTGLFTRHLATRGFEPLVATDLAPKMKAQGEKSVPGAEWRLMNAWTPVGDAYDRLYSCSLLQWAADPVTILTRWRQLLAPKGRGLFCFFVQDSLREFEMVRPSFSAVEWRTEIEWLAHLTSAGFHVHRHATWEKTAFHARPIDALRSLHGVGAVHANRDSAATLRTFLRRYEQQFSEERGFPVNWKSLRVEISRD